PVVAVEAALLGGRIAGGGGDAIEVVVELAEHRRVIRGGGRVPPVVRVVVVDEVEPVCCHACSGEQHPGCGQQDAKEREKAKPYCRSSWRTLLRALSHVRASVWQCPGSSAAAPIICERARGTAVGEGVSLG